MIRRGVSFSGMRVRPLFASCMSFSAFDGSSFETIGIGRYITIPGDGGLLRFALSSKANASHAVLDKVRTFCRPRRLINGALVTVAGLPPETVVKVRSYKVLLDTVRRRRKRRGLRLLVISGRVPTNTGLCWWGGVGGWRCTLCRFSEIYAGFMPVVQEFLGGCNEVYR